MLPVAKSTETLFLNKTLFDEFSEQTGASVEQLGSFEGLFAVANAYYGWSGGKHFTQINDFYHYALVGTTVHGSSLIQDGQLRLDDPAFKAVWEPLARAAIYGGICLEDGYAAARWKTVEIISNIGSTADVLYQPDQVIYPDNTTQAIEKLAIPYPVFMEGTAAAVHRGGGLFAIESSDERKNYAAAVFAKWLTEQENGLRFVTEAGYLPVTNAAFDALLADPGSVRNGYYRQVYDTAAVMIREYSLYAVPVFDDVSEVQDRFEESVKLVLRAAHDQYLTRAANGEDPEAVLAELTIASYDELGRAFYGTEG